MMGVLSSPRYGTDFMKFKALVPFLALATLAGCVAHVSGDALVRATPGSILTDAKSLDTNWSIQSHYIHRPGDVRLYGALFSRPSPRALVLYFGGNRFTISGHHQQILDTYSDQPVDLLIVDHRGYGGSSGEASLQDILDDAVPVYDYARLLTDYQDMPIVVHGQSLGSFMAGEVAKERKLDGLVLESSATTAEDWVQGFADNTVFVRRGVVQGELRGKGNLSVMAGLDEPILIVVGERDTTTRSYMSEKLLKAANVAPDSKEILVVPDAGHNNAALSPAFSESFTRLMAHSIGQ